MTPTKRMLACATTLTALVAALGATTTPALAADEAVTVSRLVFEPTDRGYTGSVRITIRNTGAEAQAPRVIFAEPTAGSWVDTTNTSGCTTTLDEFSPPATGRGILCRPDRILQPGETLRMTASFHALTNTRPYAMSAPDLTVRLNGDGGTFLGEASTTTRFRSTSGSLANPRPYVQDTQPNATLRAPATVLLTRRPGPDASFAGRMTVTVKWRGDSPAELIDLGTEALPPGVLIDRTEPPSARCLGFSCAIPGGGMMPGESRTFDVLLSGSVDLAEGPVGTMPLTLRTWWLNEVPDLNPADNVVQIAVTAED